MKQYLDLLQTIKEKGTYKPAAREGMPGTQSLFGYQFRHNLADGFPLLTTKKMFWKGVVIELLWFLKGDTNIKFLVDNGVNIWSEDAYNYYSKIYEKNKDNYPGIRKQNFSEFIYNIKESDDLNSVFKGYKFGDCGYQYGKVWRDWDGKDQIVTLIEGLKNNPESRRHVVTAIDPVHDNYLALYWCHAMFQFNCRPIPWEIKLELAKKDPNVEMENFYITEAAAGSKGEGFGNVPQYYLDCQLYQRSADVFLGVPFNIASYALLTEIIAKMCNMIPGEFIHTFGDVHIYDNHKSAVEEQLQRTPTELPKLNINTEFWITENGGCGEGPLCTEGFLKGLGDANFIRCLLEEDLQLSDYNPQPAIKAELSTGLKK